MKSLTKLFTDHPATVGETYTQHLFSALSFSLNLFFAAIVCLVHALLPFLFKRTGSDRIRYLHDRMVLNRARPAAKSSNDSACAPG